MSTKIGNWGKSNQEGRHEKGRQFYCSLRFLCGSSLSQKSWAALNNISDKNEWVLHLHSPRLGESLQCCWRDSRRFLIVVKSSLIVRWMSALICFTPSSHVVDWQYVSLSSTVGWALTAKDNVIINAPIIITGPYRASDMLLLGILKRIEQLSQLHVGLCRAVPAAILMCLFWWRRRWCVVTLAR